MAGSSPISLRHTHQSLQPYLYAWGKAAECLAGQVGPFFPKLIFSSHTDLALKILNLMCCPACINLKNVPKTDTILGDIHNSQWQCLQLPSPGTSSGRYSKPPEVPPPWLALRGVIMYLINSHFSLASGHPSVRRTQQILTRRYWWPTLVTDVERYVRCLYNTETAACRQAPPLACTSTNLIAHSSGLRYRSATFQW